jgi:hypothetical protein
MTDVVWRADYAPKGSCWVLDLAYSSTLKMEVLFFSETSVSFHR